MALGFIDVARLERVTCFHDKRIFLCAVCFVERFTTVGSIRIEYVRSADCNSRFSFASISGNVDKGEKIGSSEIKGEAPISRVVLLYLTNRWAAVFVFHKNVASNVYDT